MHEINKMNEISEETNMTEWTYETNGQWDGWMSEWTNEWKHEFISLTKESVTSENGLFVNEFLNLESLVTFI